jgi:hypothetical protein
MKLRITSIPNLIAFLKKLKAVDKSVILELTSDRLFSKIHTADKSVMKYSSVSLSDVLEGDDIDWKKIKGGRVKIGIIDATRLMEAFKHFRPEEDVYIELEVEDVDGQSVSTEMKLTSASLNIRLRCADLSLLSYVEDNILEMVHSKEDALANFKIYQSDFTTILSLCGLETNSEEILVFDINSKNVHANGDSFRYKLNLGPSEITMENESMLSNIYKNQLSYMESETCQVFVHANRLVLSSEQSSTSIAIGLVEK